MNRLLVFAALCVFFVPAVDLVAQEKRNHPSGVTGPDLLQLPEGFKAEVVYTVPKSQGSWVSLAVDPKGRLISSDQYGKLYRTTVDGSDVSVEPIQLDIGFAHGLLCAFDSLYVVAHATRNNPAGLYRVQDTDRDDRYDSVELLRRFEGGGEHGPHAVIRGPDLKSLYICAGNHTKIPEPETSRVPKVWQEDQVMPRLWDAGGHAVGIKAPGGWVCRTDPEGKSFELVSVGFRNQFDIAFNSAGELFTYDADMEWDVGTAWYRPTRVCHITSGSEFGWRSGTGKWPEYYQDSLPAVVDVGLGSPTGIHFGTGAKFPEKYQRALFVADWSYGVIYACHMKQEGASYSGELERFCAAPALPVADLVINPSDGCMYFVIGGRKVQSAVYRVSYVGSDSTEPISLETTGEEQDRRFELERAHYSPSGTVPIDKIVDSLSSKDRHIRFAARTALEHQPMENWRDIELSSANGEIEMVTAIARMGSQADLKNGLDRLGRLKWETLDEMQRLQLLRAYGLLRIRLDPSGETTKKTINERFADLYPTNSQLENRELSRLLSVAAPQEFVPKTINLLAAAKSQREQIHYALCLSHVKNGWSRETREWYFKWFFDAATIRGGNSLRGFLNNIRAEAIKNLDERAKLELGELVTKTPQVVDPYKELKGRPFVKKWTVDDIMENIEDRLDSADLENGRKMFSLAQCYSCHRFQGEGGIVGPDLTPAGNRYSLRDLVETLVNPNKEVSDQYQATNFLLMDGRVVTGRVVNLTGDQYMVQTDMINPSNLTRINVNDIDDMTPSTVSMMPEGLLDNLTADEIRDLIGFLKKTQ